MQSFVEEEESFWSGLCQQRQHGVGRTLVCDEFPSRALLTPRSCTRRARL